jgi:sRNA-binding regulator protein Hfq
MFEERLVLPNGFVLEARISGDQDFVLALRKGKTLLVEYSRASRYEFKSVEKLRYDFERDVENALRQG